MVGPTDIGQKEILVHSYILSTDEPTFSGAVDYLRDTLPEQAERDADVDGEVYNAFMHLAELGMVDMKIVGREVTILDYEESPEIVVDYGPDMDFEEDFNLPFADVETCTPLAPLANLSIQDIQDMREGKISDREMRALLESGASSGRDLGLELEEGTIVQESADEPYEKRVTRDNPSDRDRIHGGRDLSRPSDRV